MKKLLVVALAIAIMMSISVFAAPNGKSLGDVPVTSDDIAVDGVKDAVYDKGLILKVDTRGPDSAHASEPDTSTTGVVYVVYSNGFLHIFGEMTDSVIVPQDEAKQVNEPWMTDSLEVFVDYGNKAETPLQYRIDAYGYPSYQFPDANSYGADKAGTEGKFEWAANQNGTGFVTEFKIPATLAAGDQIGFLLQINDMVDESTRACVYVKSSLEPDSWTPDLYDYIVLSADSVTGIEIIEEAAAPAVEAPAAEVAATAPATAPVAAAQTSDSTVLYVVALIAMLGTALVVKKVRN
jgi:Domain of unknown function (DUF1083).